MFRKIAIAGCIAAGAFALAASAQAQDVTLKVHHFLSPQSPVPKYFIGPWAEKVEKESGGRIKVQIFPTMQLGGKPPSLYDQARDGVVDIIWTLTGYTPGRFPKSEAFELPFIAGKGAATSEAAWDYYDKNLRDEFKDVNVIAAFVHGPGLVHANKPVEKLEDMKGLKLRGPTRMTNMLLNKLGAIPVGMPVPAVPEALSKHVIDGAVVPWEVSVPLRIPELVHNHTGFTGSRGLYTSFMVFAMNKARYESLPDDLKKIIDDNSGREASRLAGLAMDKGDMAGPPALAKLGDKQTILDEAETQRWKDAAREIEAAWIEEMNGKGFDGAKLVEDAKAAISTYVDDEKPAYEF